MSEQQESMPDNLVDRMPWLKENEAEMKRCREDDLYFVNTYVRTGLPPLSREEFEIYKNNIIAQRSKIIKPPVIPKLMLPEDCFKREDDHQISS